MGGQKDIEQLLGSNQDDLKWLLMILIGNCDYFGLAVVSLLTCGVQNPLKMGLMLAGPGMLADSDS